MGYEEIWHDQTLRAYLKTWDVSCDWLYTRYIFFIKSGSQGAGLGKKESLASMGRVILLYNKTITRIERWRKDDIIVGSSEEKY